MSRCLHVRFLGCQTAPMLPWTSVAGGPLSAHVASAPRSVLVVVVISQNCRENLQDHCFGLKVWVFVNSKVSLKSRHAMLSLVFSLIWLIY